MHRRNKLCVSLGPVYGLVAGALALVHLAWPGLVPGNVPRAHGHMMTLGFVLMTIYGVGLHVLPRFGGYPLRSERLAALQFWSINAGLPAMVTGWLALADWLVHAGGALVVASMGLFAYNMVFSVRLRSPLDPK